MTGRKPTPRGVARARIPQEQGHLAAQLAAIGPDAIDCFRKFVVVNALDMWKDCPIAACRRKRTCRGREMECFTDRNDELRRRAIAHAVYFLFTAGVSSDEFYDYLEAGDEEADDAAGIADDAAEAADDAAWS